jgi:hypothetical protein
LLFVSLLAWRKASSGDARSPPRTRALSDDRDGVVAAVSATPVKLLRSRWWCCYLGQWRTPQSGCCWGTLHNRWRAAFSFSCLMPRPPGNSHRAFPCRRWAPYDHDDKHGLGAIESGVEVLTWKGDPASQCQQWLFETETLNVKCPPHPFHPSSAGCTPRSASHETAAPCTSSLRSDSFLVENELRGALCIRGVRSVLGFAYIASACGRHQTCYLDLSESRDPRPDFSVGA